MNDASSFLTETIEKYIPRSGRATPSIMVLSRNHHRGRRVKCLVLEGIVTESMQFEVLIFGRNSLVVELEEAVVSDNHDKDLEDYTQKFPFLPGTVFVATIVGVAEKCASSIFDPENVLDARAIPSRIRQLDEHGRMDQSNKKNETARNRLVSTFTGTSGLRALPWSLQRNKIIIWNQIC